MAKYQLLVSQHVGPDCSKKPRTFVNPETGEVTKKFPSRTFAAGDIIESDDDLVAKFGAEKFRLMDGQRAAKQDELDSLQKQIDEKKAKLEATKEPVKINPSVAPGGQVSSGTQEGLSDEIALRTGVGSKAEVIEDDKHPAAPPQPRPVAPTSAPQPSSQPKPTGGNKK